MDFYKKIKQKIEEELNQDEDEEDEEEAEEPPNSEFGDTDNASEYRSSNAENKRFVRSRDECWSSPSRW